MKLALDTSYICKSDNIQSLLDYASDLGIVTLDTSALYPNSEHCLGQYNLEKFDVITKTIMYDYTLSRYENFENIKNTFYSSQRKLGYIELYGILFSSGNDILDFPELWDLICDFKDKNYVYKIGVNVSTPNELIDIIDSYDIDIAQLPLNIFDQDFIGLLPELKQKNIEIHTRNTFKEGILLKNIWQLPEKYKIFKPILEQIPEPKVAYALNLPKLLKEVDKIIIPALSTSDLDYFINMYNFDTYNIDYAQFRTK